LYNVSCPPTGGIAITTGSSSSTYTVFGNNVWNDQDMCGAYFTGLNQNDVLTVNYNIYIERFPALSDLNLIVLATPSPAYDAVAMQVYSDVSRRMPTGVPQAENGLGDWFKGIISTVADVAGTILPMIPHPKAQIGGAIAGGIGKLLRSSDQSEGIGEAKIQEMFQQVRNFEAGAREREALKGRYKTAPNSYNNPNNGMGNSFPKKKTIRFQPRKKIIITNQQLQQAKNKLRKRGPKPRNQPKTVVVVKKRGFPLGI